MAMVCPQCHTSHEQRLQCPTCGTRLTYADLRGQARRPSAPASHWMQSFAGRMVIGLILSQGLFFGLRHLYISFLLATQGDDAVVKNFQTVEGLLFLESLQLLPLFLGGLLAGSGQRQGLALGLMIGVVNSILCMLSQALLTHQVHAASWYGQPLLQACFGCLGGWIGSTIWKPLATPNLPHPSHLGRKLGGVRRQVSILAGRVAWIRVVLGALLAVAGSVWAEYVLQAVLNASAGKLDTSTRFQDTLFSWEIRALAILFGGALAGATTSNGIKQGLCVGLATCMVLLAIPRGHTTAAVALLTTLATFALSVAGGWFGSHLLPPVISLKNKNSFRTAP